jgi:small subunit ribosomal protein S17
MADEDKTPETPDSIQEEVQTAASEEGAGDTSTKPAAAVPAEPQEVLEPKERRARRRAANKPAARGPLTPEQRDEERRARRAHKAKLRRAYRLREKAKTAEQRAAAPAPEPDHAPEHGPGRAKVRQGIVVSDKADKTIVVRVDVTRRHRRYGKIMRTSSKIHAHDERNDAGAGDTVRVIECRPMSRTKRWRLTDVLEKAK